MQTARLAPGHTISQIIRGGWQLAGGHGPVETETAIDGLIACADAGITTFDCADIYTGVEELIGRFRMRYRDFRGEEALSHIKVHTKLVPDLDALPGISRGYVERIIDTSCKRLRTERLDLVQFHWWDYAVPGMEETAGWLGELRAAGRIAHLGGTNFNTDAMLRLIEAGVPLVSMQVQYSLLDDRPAKRMAAEGRRNGVSLLCYGTVAGGFLSERWLGAVEPAGALENRSLTKYKLIIDDAGGWDWFQALLEALDEIAGRHGVDIATVASRAVLDHDGVAAVIVGARDRSHIAANIRVSRLRLDPGDHRRIEAVLAARTPLAGDVYDLERDRASAHGAIMRYNLNKGVA